MRCCASWTLSCGAKTRGPCRVHTMRFDAALVPVENLLSVVAVTAWHAHIPPSLLLSCCYLTSKQRVCDVQFAAILLMINGVPFERGWHQALCQPAAAKPHCYECAWCPLGIPRRPGALAIPGCLSPQPSQETCWGHRMTSGPFPLAQGRVGPAAGAGLGVGAGQQRPGQVEPPCGRAPAGRRAARHGRRWRPGGAPAGAPRGAPQPQGHRISGWHAPWDNPAHS